MSSGVAKTAMSLRYVSDPFHRAEKQKAVVTADPKPQRTISRHRLRELAQPTVVKEVVGRPPTTALRIEQIVRLRKEMPASVRFQAYDGAASCSLTARAVPLMRLDPRRTDSTQAHAFIKRDSLLGCGSLPADADLPRSATNAFRGATHGPTTGRRAPSPCRRAVPSGRDR